MPVPVAARVLLRLVDPAVREFVSGDLQEAFDAMAHQDARAARSWVIRQSLAAALQHPWLGRRRAQRAGGRPRGDGFMRTFLQDLRFGARTARRQPAFSIVVILTLALAIGANSVIFTFSNVLLIRPLPLKDPNTLGWIFLVDPHQGGNRGTLSIPELLDYRRMVTAFSAIAASTRGSVTLTGRGDARRLAASRVTANLFDVWGVRLAQGRAFSVNADAPGASGEVVLSHHFWDRELNRDPAAVGRTLMLDGRPATIVGVAAQEIEFGSMADLDVWVPITLSVDAPRQERTLRVTGRLAPGATLQQANADVARAAQVLAQEHPATNQGWAARVAPTREAITGNDTWPILLLLSLVVGFVLLLACANLANLVLSRATGRQRELAVRSALGAGRARVMRQMLTENLIYGVCGGLLGLVVAQAGLSIMKATAYEAFFQLLEIDRNVLGFTAALAVVTPVLFGMLPALQSTRANTADALKDGGRTAVSGRGARSRSVLVVAQLSLAVMLLVLTSLLVQALVNIQRAPLGLDAPKLLTARLELPAWRYTNDAAVRQFERDMIARLRANPAVEHAAAADRLPFIDGERPGDVTIDGRPAARPEDRPWAVKTRVSDAYFAAAGLQTIAGRTFGPQDEPDRGAVAVVNKEMARRFWGSPDRALGARVTVAGDPAPVEIIGVTADVLRADREGVNPELFLPIRQRPSRAMTLIVRAGDPAAIAADVRTTLRALDADVPVFEIRPFQQAIDEDLSSSHILGGLFTSFALLALVLAASGLYAVVSYATAQRTKEFGVRVALGATGADLVRMMLRQTTKLVAVGLVLGLIGGRLLATGASTLLYRVSASDPATYAGVAIVLAAIAFVASYVPVRRALAIDPVSALRLE